MLPQSLVEQWPWLSVLIMLNVATLKLLQKSMEDRLADSNQRCKEIAAEAKDRLDEARRLNEKLEAQNLRWEGIAQAGFALAQRVVDRGSATTGGG